LVKASRAGTKIMGAEERRRFLCRYVWGIPTFRYKVVGMNALTKNILK
jgi:hypothetical protein